MDGKNMCKLFTYYSESYNNKTKCFPLRSYSFAQYEFMEMNTIIHYYSINMVFDAQNVFIFNEKRRRFQVSTKKIVNI